ncbi:hypothetical protein EXIGLDRAFT_617879 [Exidia glandulosa HHB12029]|uniref:Uncharacterized protein n=2 Tax=Exidia glandulosa HHB12029 TaxID=1314781 RepID=A0A165FXT9_EXIGL|nr:hypothetical protein EXIGLDRAFT_617879 [Exidia glandulosa HHB12029]
MQTGCYYPRGKVRSRPEYPNLKDDGKIERSIKSGKGGIGCDKYYEAYGKGGLTGGLMALWCTHSICYGFHIIPKGEGRNDVFSALYCYWETMPEVLIYDYACAVAPYCMAREPDLYKATLAVVDKFHGANHKSCSGACMMTNYIRTDPSLDKYNSSAAESGNSALGRIRKSMSYMTQEHAIVFTQVFLSLWNRMKVRNLS